MKKIKITDLLIFILSAELIGVLSSLISGGSFEPYYEMLAKPPLAPPAWLFPVVWAVLYAVMGLSACIIYSAESSSGRFALNIYWVQLAVNALWSPVFFGMRSFGGAAAVVVAMLILIVWMTVSFNKINRCAALLNIPYLVWTVFAAYLTFGFMILNAG